MAVSIKLRRGEKFFNTWPVPAFMGSGRHSIWIDTAVRMQFVYDRKVNTKLDMDWMTKILGSRDDSERTARTRRRAIRRGNGTIACLKYSHIALK